MIRFSFAAAAACVAFCAAAPASSLFVLGTVQDPQGRLVPGVEISLYQPGVPVPLARARTNDGAFRMPVQNPGTYLLEAVAKGFRSTSFEAVAGQSVNIRLEIAGVDERIVVISGSTPQTVDELSKAVSVIAAEELLQRNEYSITEALRDVPGVLVRNLGGPGQVTTIRVRGLRADSTSLLIDGLRFRDSANIQGDASSFLATLNVINPERVEMLRGSGSSLYGSNAVGGTVNVVTDPGGGPLRGGIQVEGGSLGFLRGRASISGGILQDRLTYSAGVLHLNVLEGVDGDDRTRSSGAQGFSRWQVTSSATLSGRVLFSDDFAQTNTGPTASGLPASNIPASLLVPAIPLGAGQLLRASTGLPFAPGNATYIPNRNDPDSRAASRFQATALIYRQRLAAPLDLQVTYQRTGTERIYRNGPAGVGFQPPVSNYSQFRGAIDTADARLNWRPRSWLTASGGYEMEREGYLGRDDNRLPAPATLQTKTSAWQSSRSAYFASQFALLGRRLQIALSGREQSFALERPQFQFAGTATNYDSAGSTVPPRALTGDVALSYFAARTGTKLRAHAGNAYRAPGLYERFGSGFFYSSAANAVIYSAYGDPRLAPDRYNSGEAGIDQYFLASKLRLSATWFYTRIVQITQFDSVGNAVGAARDPFGRFAGYLNGAGGISRGVESTAEFRPGASTFVRGSYSYVNANTDRDLGVRGVYRALGIPIHSWNLMAHRRLGRKWDVTADLYHASDSVSGLFVGTRTRAYVYPGFTKIDVILNRELLQRERWDLRWYVSGSNILNQRYYENGFQAARGTVLSGIQIQRR